MFREGLGFSEGFVFLIGRCGIGCRNRIVRFFARAEVIGIFADDCCVLALLTSGVLNLDDAREFFIVGIIRLFDVSSG